MDGKEMMKDLYKYFGEKKEEDQGMYSIANIFYEMGTKELISNPGGCEIKTKRRDYYD